MNTPICKLHFQTQFTLCFRAKLCDCEIIEKLFKYSKIKYITAQAVFAGYKEFEITCTVTRAYQIRILLKNITTYE